MSSILNNFINLQDSQFAGYWYEEKQNKLFAGTLSLSTSNSTQFIIIDFYQYTFSTDNFKKILTDTIESPIFIKYIKEPISLTYNKDTFTFNISFICNLFNLFSLDIKHFSDSTYISNVTLFDSPVITTPTPTCTPTRTPTPTVTPTHTPSSTVTPTLTLSLTITPTPTLSLTITPTPTLSLTITPTPTITQTISVTPTITQTISVTPTNTPTITPTETPTNTPTPTVTPTITPTETPTNTPTPTVTPTSTRTNSPLLITSPRSIVFDSTGEHMFTNNSNSIIRINLTTKNITVWAGQALLNGYVDSNDPAAARFNVPCGIEIDSTGIVYIADQNNGAIRTIVPGANPTLNITNTLAGDVSNSTSSQDGCNINAWFSSPTGIVRTSSTDSALRDRNDGDRVYVSEANSHVISKVVISTGCKTTIAGSSLMSNPNGITLSQDGLDLYVADTGSNTVKAISLRDVDYGTVSVIAGLAGFVGSTDGDGTAARFRSPIDVAVDAAGNIYVSDWVNHTIRKISGPTRTVTTIAGVAGASGTTDGIGSNARFNRPRSIQVDPLDIYLYITDQLTNSRVRLLELNTHRVITLQD